MPRGRKKKFKIKFDIKPETIRSILSLVFILLSLLSLVSFFAPNYSINSKIQEILRGLFGITSIIIPILLGITGFLFIQNFKAHFKDGRVIIGLFLALLSISSLLHSFIFKNTLEVAQNGNGGGIVGYKISQLLISNISVYGAIPTLFLISIISLCLVFNISFDQIIAFIQEKLKDVSISDLFRSTFTRKSDDLLNDVEVSSGVTSFRNGDEDNSEFSSYDMNPSYAKMPEFEVIPSFSEPQIHKNIPISTSANISSEAPLEFMKRPIDKIWVHPPYTLLSEPPLESRDTSEADGRKKIIKDTLRNFGIEVDIEDAKVGSSVTQYSLRTKSVTKVSKIASLQEDLAMALASPTGSVRIEAPIPGTQFIGIEVPNSSRSMVFFKSLITADPMRNLKSKLGTVLGKDVAGRTYVHDIAKMPHMLIAGATGSGKSVFIHNVLFSILYRATPQEVKFILIDPKRVELTHYQGIPHLLTPVVTDMDKAPSAFKWAVDEMERRYKLFEQAKVRNIESYNEKSGIQVMPYIIIIVDELGEIMVKDPTGVEKSIIRLAQLARATGIHLILAVQRPSTNVITGLIKANITCRVAFNVTSQIDSRVIIDQPGAEKLLGKGDMLFIPPDAPKPVRLQGSFISDKEISDLVSYLKSQGIDPDYKEEVLQMSVDSNKRGSVSSSTWGEDVDDDNFDAAVDVVLTSGKASASLLQRKLSIGYARAARIIDLMEEKGIIGPASGGSKPRDVLIDQNDISRMKGDIDELDEFDQEKDNLSNLNSISDI